MSEETSIGWQGGRKLHFNGTITYRSAVPTAACEMIEPIAETTR